MLLTSAQQQIIARRAQWYFDCYFGPPSDSVVFTGDGVDDLDSLIDRLNTNAMYNISPGQKFMCDVGSQYSDWRPFDIEDVYAIRLYFIGIYGDVSRPNVYASGSNVAIPITLTVEP